ncbi:MAG TPA: peroxidase family protein [Actinophytocola sp.]|uniref:peroxidase family protein n=1 Tax=Actinophytocola sp. TaxID=1872138 RepID=UPI002DBCD16E|nr:peroxidase family protein [Actinophytocola sp.]HEU5472630.1 peroxidase family protein [Actinophytocola sp.]
MSVNEDVSSNPESGIGRRRFLGGVGAGVAGAAAGAMFINDIDPAAAQTEGPAVAAAPDPRFSRMFNLPSFADPRSTAVRNAMNDIGKLGGVMDARDPLEVGPVRLITEPGLSPRNVDQNIANMTAGTTFVGQFLDHDITFDASSPLGTPAEPAATTNVRDARLDLDSVFGGGPSVSPNLYDPNDRAKFRISSGGRFEDLIRNTSDRSAVIADPRNDENMMISGLQVAFQLAHNRAVDLLRQQGQPNDVWFFARRMIIHHWQWLVVNEFLPQVVGSSLVNDILRNGRRWYRFNQPSMPVEFQTGAYRFGHSMVRPSYRANRSGDPSGSAATGAPAFFGFIFDPAGEGQSNPVDLRGGARATRRFIGWETFFDFGGQFTQHTRPNKLIDTNISTPLFRLPLATISSRTPPISLPQRNLLRHMTWSMPSGQRIAQATGSPILASSNFPELRTYNLGLDSSTPLWYYILREAQVVNQGVRLGPVGGRIVAETIIGLLQLDEFSYLNNNFRPTLPSTTPGNFKITDMLRWARVDPATRNEQP